MPAVDIFIPMIFTTASVTTMSENAARMTATLGMLYLAYIPIIPIPISIAMMFMALAELYIMMPAMAVAMLAITFIFCSSPK